MRRCENEGQASIFRTSDASLKDKGKQGIGVSMGAFWLPVASATEEEQYRLKSIASTLAIPLDMSHRFPTLGSTCQEMSNRWVQAKRCVVK
jgi:hypothetical protein